MARNTYFQFKQFRITQDRCVMKVCTDACVLGAWADATGAGRVLDIGTGTGLLALMVAQQNPEAMIDAVELDEAAVQQARENSAASPFGDRVRILSAAVQDYTADGQYDVILTNPPFFQSDLLSPDAGVNRAHHAQTLSLKDLLSAVSRLLKKSGRWYVLLPVEESRYLQGIAGESDWVAQSHLLLTHQPGRRPFRRLTAYAHASMQPVTNPAEELFIYENDGKTYTSAFRALLKEYYLVF